MSSSKFTIHGAKRHYAPDLLIEPIHMMLKLKIDINRKSVEGSNTVTLVSNSTNTNFVKFNAVDFEYVNIDTPNVNWEYDEKFISVTFNENVPKGTKVDLKIDYKVVEPSAGLYFSHFDEEIKWCGSDHETERARHWFPCIDFPNVRTSYRWELTSNEDYIILANGKLTSEKSNGDETKTVIWDHNYPCPSYLAAIALGHLTEYIDHSVDAGKGTIPIAYYGISKYSPEDLFRSFGRTPEMIKWYVKKFDHAMAWDKYYQFAMPDLVGAMENQSLVSWDDFAILDAEAFEEFGGRVDSINIHELAHTFFGDMLVMSHFSHAWLKESWAMYVDALWHEDTKGMDDFQYRLFNYAQTYFAEADSRYVRPIVHNYYNNSWQLFDGHLYPGGAWRLHMLRRKLGDEQFFTAIKEYVSTYSGKIVETVDFKRILEKNSGLNLTRFFDDWLLTAKGYPKLKISFKYNPKKKLGKFKISQEQIKSKDPNSDQPFHLDLEVGIAIDDTADLELHVIEIREAHHVFYVNLEKQPYQVLIDPNDKILFRQNLDIKIELLINQLKSSTASARLYAVQALCKNGKRKAIKAVVNHYEIEEFYGIRAEIYNSLSKTNSQETIKAFARFIQKEQEKRNLPVLFNHAGKFRDPLIEESILFAINNGLGPHSLGSALIALGKQRNNKHQDLILEYTKYEGWNDIVKSSAYQALAELRDPSMISKLIEDFDTQVHEARKSIVSALAKITKYDELQYRPMVIEKLIDMLRDEDDKIRIRAVNALGSLKAQEAIPYLLDLKVKHPQQQDVIFDKAISGIRSVKKFKEMPKLLEEIDKLSKEIRDLKSDIEDLKAKSRSQN
ncbi:MAG: M1 family aminopeptidase [Candidatus Kariarchaeaceae archaeon]|jgi:aminopeptidase N